MSLHTTLWRKNNPEAAKFSARKSNIKLKSKGQGLAVDHDHITGEVRALLCIPCNSAIGQLKEDPNIIMNAMQYVIEQQSKRERKR